jgi:hypothetical protein
MTERRIRLNVENDQNFYTIKNLKKILLLFLGTSQLLLHIMISLLG